MAGWAISFLREKIVRVRKRQDLKSPLGAGLSEDREEQAGSELSWDEAIFPGAHQDDGSFAGSLDQVREVDRTSAPEKRREGGQKLPPATHEAKKAVNFDPSISCAPSERYPKVYCPISRPFPKLANCAPASSR